jgi:hypothetical protein
VAFDCYTSANCELNQSGTYRLVIADRGLIYTGSYEVHFAKVTESNENGSLINDAAVLGDISQGDIDSFVFTANAGDSVHLRITDIDDGNFSPEVWLYNPDGTLLVRDNSTTTVAFDCYTSANCELNQSGTYRLVIADRGLIYTGNYEVHFAKETESN